MFAIGFDPAGWEPTQEELESWQLTAEEYEIVRAIQEHTAVVTVLAG